MSDNNRNNGFLFDESGQGAAAPDPSMPAGSSPGYYDNASGYPVYPDYNYNYGAAPAGPAAPSFNAPVAYDSFGNPVLYNQDYGGMQAGYAQADPYYSAYPVPDPGYPYSTVPGPYPQAPQQPQQPAYPVQQAPAYPMYPSNNPFDQTYMPVQPDPWGAPQQGMPIGQQPYAPSEQPSQEFAQKFAEVASGQTASGPDPVSQVSDKGFTGFDQLADALESKVSSQARTQTDWPPKRETDSGPDKAPAPQDVFDSGVSLEPDTRPVQKNEPKAPMGDDEISRVAEELSQAVLVKSYSRAFNDNNLMREGPQRCMEAENLSAEYYISDGGASPYPMFQDIAFGLNAGSCCALVSDIALSTYVLARAIAENADAGFDDIVRVADSPDGDDGHIFYIGSDTMLPKDMSVEDFLMYTMASKGRTDDEDYDKLSILLSQMGMSNIQENVLSEQSYNMRILILILAAALNSSVVSVIVNDPRFQVGAEDEMVARRVFSFLGSRGKCSIISCCSATMMSAVANRVAVLRQGQMVFFGDYKRFLDEYCLGLMSFTVSDSQTFAMNLERVHPEISVLCKDRLVYLVRRPGFGEVRLDALIRDIIALGADYSTIVMDEKSFGVACKEVLGI